MSEVTDEAVVAEALDYFDRGGLYYRVTSAIARGNRLVLEISVKGDKHVFGLEVPMPSSSEAHWWLYAPPVDANDWLGQLRIWIDEEIETGAADWAVTEERDGVCYFVVQSYGFKTSNLDEHVRRTAANPTLGWRAYPGA